MKRTLIAALAATAAMFIPTLATADDQPFDGDLTAQARSVNNLLYRGWGAWQLAEQLDGSLGEPVAIPGSTDAVTVDLDERRLARVDYRSGEITLGDQVDLPVSRLTVTPGATWVYVETSNGFAAPRFTRFNLETLERDVSFSLDNTDYPSRGLAVAGMPGDEGRLVVVGSGVATVFDDGVAQPDVARSISLSADSVAAANQELAYAGGSTGLWSIELTPTGVGAVTQILTSPRGAPIRIVDNLVVTEGMAIDVGGSVQRPATDFEQAIRDPRYNIRYVIEPTRTMIFAEETGEVLANDEERCLVDEGTLGLGRFEGTIIGGGLIVDRRGVADIIDRCGSYGEFTPVAPDRVFDTRSGLGNDGVPQRLVGGDTTRVKIHGLGGVPETGVAAVVLNVTPVDQRDAPAGSFVTVWPAGFPQPEVASLTVSNGEIVGNMVTVATGEDGHVDVFVRDGSTDLVIDVMGYFSLAFGPEGDRYSSVPVYRALDTRDTSPLSAGQKLTLTPDQRLVSEPGIDWTIDDVSALVLNVTAVGPSASSNLRVYPAGNPLPSASSMNFPGGADTNRLVTSMVGPGGAVDIWNAAGTTDVVVDVVGVFVAVDRLDQAGRFVGAAPFRYFDSRESSPYPGSGKIFADSLLSYRGAFPEENYVVNLTVHQPEGPGYLSATTTQVNPDVLPDLTRTSSLNYRAGQTVGNQSIISTGFEGSFAVYTLAQAHIIIDFFGYYTSRGSVVL